MNTQKIMLNCDWLGLSLHISGEPKQINGFVWKEYSSTNVWEKRRVLWTEEGDRVLTLLSSPRSSIINKQSALCEIENEWLYHGGGHVGVLKTLEKSLFFLVTGISRLDLAADFCPTDTQKDIILGLGTGEYYIGGKNNRVPWYGKLSNEKLHPMWNNRNIPYDQSWGHKTTDIKWKLYYKTKELLDAGGGKFFMKPYIVDQWRINGLDERNVWRVEVSIKKLNNYDLYGQRLNLDNIERNFQELFLQLYNSRFKVKLNEGHKDHTNDKTVTFLPVANIFYTMQRHRSDNGKSHNGRISLLRHLVQSLDDEQVLLDKISRENVYDHIYKILERDNLQNYFMAMTGKYFDEWVAAKDEEASGSITIDIDRPHMNNDILPNRNAEKIDPSTAERYNVWLHDNVKGDLLP